MAAPKSTRVLAAVSLIGLAAAIWHGGVNYQWRDHVWSPPAPWLVPLAAALPPIAVYLGLKETFRKTPPGNRLAGIGFTLLALLAILVALAPLSML